jgi:branched-subunit amino acid permease
MEIFLQSHRNVPWICLHSFFMLQELWHLTLFKDLQMISIKSFKKFRYVHCCLPSLQIQCLLKSLTLVFGKNNVIILKFLFTLNSFTTSITTVIATFVSIYVGTSDFSHWVIFLRCNNYLVQVMLLDVMIFWRHIMSIDEHNV